MLKVLLTILILSNVAQAQFILKPKNSHDWLMNTAFVMSYTGSIIDSQSTTKALQNPIRHYRETSPLYNWAIDERCPCGGKRVTLGLGYTVATNLAFHYAYRKSGDQKWLKGVVIVGRFIATAALIPTIRQNLRNSKY